MMVWVTYTGATVVAGPGSAEITGNGVARHYAEATLVKERPWNLNRYLTTGVPQLRYP